jgi:hypothetical protein
MEVPEIIVENVFMDFKKKDIDERLKAALIQNYRNKHRLSQRGFGDKFGIPYSTVQDWERWLKIPNDDWEKLKKQGLSKTDVYRELRNNQMNVQKVVLTKLVDVEIRKAHALVRPFVKDNLDYSEETASLVKDLVNTLNRILMRVDK